MISSETSSSSNLIILSVTGFVVNQHVNHYLECCLSYNYVIYSRKYNWIYIMYRGEQVHIMCSMEELMPSIGTSVPSPSVLAVIICQSDSTLQNVGKLFSDVPHSPVPDMDFDNPFDFCGDSLFVCKTHLISISDDGKIWNWLLTAEGAGDNQKEDENLGVRKLPIMGTNCNNVVSSIEGPSMEAGKRSEPVNDGRSWHSSSSISQGDMSFKVCL